MTETKFPHKHLIGIQDLSADDIRLILDRANDYADDMDKNNYPHDLLKDKIILTLFFEDSTRTQTSFDIAAKRLGAQVVNLNVKTSSQNKGETFEDTIHTLNAMRPDCIIMRHHEHGAPVVVAKMVDCPVINAGDSWREHPTQALLDALTIQRKIGDVASKNIAMIGDIAHSRVANSNMHIFSKLGANITVIAPEILMPQKFPIDNIKTSTNLIEGLNNIDIVISDRIYLERMEGSPIKSEAGYFEEFGLTKEKLKHANDGVILLAPGPIIRGVQMDDAVADDKDNTLILEQVKNGVPTRMAVMALLMEGE